MSGSSREIRNMCAHECAKLQQSCWWLPGQLPMRSKWVLVHYRAA